MTSRKHKKKTKRYPEAVALLLLHTAAALGLVALVLVASTPPAHAQTQTPSFRIEAVYSGLPEVYEGAQVRFRVTRTAAGVPASDVTVAVEIWEPNLDDGNGDNPSLRTLQLTFPGTAVVNSKIFSVTAYVDGVDESAESSHILKARLVASSDGSYDLDAENEAELTILDPPSTVPRISIVSDSTGIAEGDAASFTLTRTGDTASSLTVPVRVDDPSGFTRGNHWDPPPTLPTSVEFDANSSTATVTLQTLDDHRDSPDASITLEVDPARMQQAIPYLLGHTGLETEAGTAVTDNDTAQELELNFGEEGVNDADVTEGEKLAFVVKRRQQDADTGNPATFTVRIETDRSGDDWRLEDWTEDTGTGRLYKDYPLQLTGSDLQVKEEFTVTANGQSESNWDYRASLKPLQAYGDAELASGQETEYWTVKPGFRETTVDATDSGAVNGTISIESDVAIVTEGDPVVFTLYRVDGPMNKPVTVRVRTREPNRGSGGNNPSREFHDVTIEAWRGYAEFSVHSSVDGVTEAGTDELIANIVSISQVDGADRYTEGLPNQASVEINDPPSGSTLVTVAANPTSVVEGGTTTITFTRTGGDSAQPLTVNILVDDPEDRLRGNHWDPAPAIPTEVTFPANSSTQTLTLTFPDDQRDLATAGLVKVHVLPGTGYYLGQSGNSGTFTTLSVADNDTAQELTLKWGRISPDSVHWEEGESYRSCDGGGTCTPGPAEGTFYYEDGRSFVVSHELQEPHPAHFLVSRRASDTGKTATFVVRVEHNRGWDSPRHSDWPIDPETGNRYKEFPLTLTGNQRQVVGRIEVLDNGLVDHALWQYSAEIIQIEDAAVGTALSPADEARYWTVNGARTKTIWPDLVLGVLVKVDSVAPKRIPEGQAVTITLERRFGNPLEPYAVQVRTWEPNQAMADGTNPTEHVHDVVFPAVPMTDLFVEYVTQTETLTVSTWDDSLYEPRDTFVASLLVPSALSDGPLLISTKKATILDDDRPTITLSVDDTSITEGDTATFTLTRGNNTADELLVGVSMDDPGGFLDGNFASEAVAVPSSIMFAPGETTKEVAIAVPDDWRDIPDNAMTFTVAQEPDYDIVGSTSLTVQVADNDVAPQVSISFNHDEVDEGTDLVLQIVRTGEDKNPLEIPLTAGPVGEEQYHVFGMDAGMSLLHFTYRQPDDSFRGPDHHYTATLHPGRAEFWLPGGSATVNGAILDNDPYVVSVEAITPDVDEGNLLYYRISHDGHTGDPLRVRVNHVETGSAVYDTILGNEIHTIHAGSSSITRAYLTHRNDGYDGDAEFTVELLQDATYEIDGDSSSATVIVRDKDPLPVLGFRDPETTVSEGVGTVDIWVDLLAAVHPLKTVTVDYRTRDWYTGDGFNLTQTEGTLTFAPGETSAAINVEILQNSIAGSKDRFHVVLSNPVNAVLQDGAFELIHDGVIEDDESAVTLEAQAEAVDEGSDVILTLTRDGDPTDELTVWLQVAKSAPQAESRLDTVVFPAGDATVAHTIATTDDGVRAGSHTVAATLVDPPTIGQPRTYWVGRPSSDTVTVRETHVETVTLLTPTLRVAEGDSITLELARSGRAPLTVTLDVTETGDYTTGALPETVTFGLQEGNVTVTIPTENDTTAEDIGKLTVTLVDGTDYRAGWPNSHTFTIYDDDGVKPSVSVTKDQNWVNEGQPVSFTVARSTPTDNALQARLELNRVRYRVTRADLDDPTRGITTPENHIHFDTEEITVDFPAGTRSVTVTRQTTDDSLNYGNSTYHATVLNDADDDYIALSNASALIWVQDDDVATVTGSSTTSEFFDGRYQVVLPFTRTGDVTGRLPLDYDRTHVGLRPAPLQDETETRTWIKGHGFDPDTATGVSIGDLGYTDALGRSGTLELEPHYCPNNPAACGYYPQYQVGTPSSISYRYYSNTMGVRIERDKGSVAEGDPATFTLHRHGGKPDAMTRPLEVQVSVTQEGEYISGAAPQTVTFAANQSTATLSVPTTDDGVDETDGAITVELVYTWSRGCDDEYCYRQREYQGSPWYVRSVTTAVTDNDYLLPDVSVSDASAGEADGTIDFTVTLDRVNNERAASVDWTTAEDGSTDAATSDVDFTSASGTVNFAIGETEKTVTVSLLDDQLDEADETFNVVLSNPSELTLADDTGTGTILDDDYGYGIAFSHSTFHTEEGDDVVVLLQRLVPQDSGGGVCYVTIQHRCFSVATKGDLANGAITVNLDITQVGDFLSSLPPTTVTFAQGVAAVELSLPTEDDGTVEADGSLSFNILDGTGYSPAYIGPPDSHNQGVPYRTLYLYDNDLAFSIDDVQADESAGQMDFTVSLNGAAPQEVTVDVATVDGDATSHANVTASSLGQDFVAKTDTLTFAAGEQTKTFSVVTLDDTIHERNETFTVELGIPSQNLNRYNSARRWSTLTSLSDDTAVGTIVDDEQPLVASVSRSYSIVNEDQVGPVRFTIELAHPATTASERNPAVGWRTVADTAAPGADYQDADGKLTFKPGVTTGFIDVDIVDDNLFENALESFSLELVASDSRFVTISPADATFEVSIRDNETLTASIAANAGSVAEGNDTTFTVTLTGGVPADDVSVPFETAGTATVVDDYAAPKGSITFPPGDASGKAGVLEIPAGQSRGTITFPVLADGIDDDDETLEVEIFSVATPQRAGSVSATANVATTTILDQDSLTISIGDAPSVTEGAAATFTITLSTASDRDVSAGWSTKEAGDAPDTGETALPDKDYMAATGTVAIPAGDRSATFTVTTTDDTLVEGTETFLVTLEEATIGSSSPAEMVPLGVTEAEGTILDDDTAPTGLTISSVSPNQVDEDAGATDITVTVALDGTTQFTVGTPVTVEMIDRPGVRNNATLGVDYTATTANVTIPAGESSVTTTITLTPVDDTVSEDDEIARLSVKSTVFDDSAGRGVRIVDNDVEPGEVMLTVTPDTAGESASSLRLTVTGTLAGQSSRVIDTVVSLELADGTATAGEDYESATATLTIPAGEMSATAAMTLEVLDDDIAEGNETLKVTGTVPGTIAVAPADVVIEDDDQEPTSISLLATTGPIGEGGGAVTIPVRATLLGGGTRSVDTEVTLSVNDVSATVTDDYSAAWDSSTLTIPAGESSATADLTLTPVDDSVYEGNEQVAVRGTNTDPGLPVNGVRLTIVDNDPQPTTVTLSLDSDTVVEGSGTHFPNITATLEGDSTLTSDVNFTVTLSGDTQRSQSYSAYLFSPLRIEAGQPSGTADMWLLGTDDDVEDDDEIVTFEGAADHPDLTVVPARLTIANDDTSGVRVSPTSLTVREGEQKRYAVALTSEPTSNVVLTVDAPANAAFTVNPGTLTFGPRSWGWKHVYVTGIEDPDAEDEPAADISHSLSSSDTKYAGAASDNVTVTVKDTVSASVIVAPTELSIGEGDSDAYTVVLDTQPTGDVTVTISGFAGTAVTLDKTTLTFTMSNWNVQQTVTVTANQDANAIKEIIPLTNTVSGGGYDGIAADSVEVTVTDDDTAGVTVRPTAITVVGGSGNEYTVVLDTEPAGDVEVTIAGATGTDLSLDNSTLTFTDQDWDTPQVVTVSASDDASADTVTLTHTVQSTDDADYDEAAADSVTVWLLPAPDGPLVHVGVTTSDQELTVPEGDNKTYSVVLGTRPEGDVTVAIAGITGTDLALSDSSLTFTTANWNTAQTVTVTAAHDDDAVDEEVVTITHTVTSADDSAYDGLTAAGVAVTVTDDDTAAVTISETTLDIDEGDSDTYTVALDTQPVGNVTVTVGGVTGTDLTLSDSSLTFTTANWNTARTVTVTAGQDDNSVDEEVVTITHTVTSADDSAYDGVSAGSVAVTVTDDDPAGVTISETSLDIGEGGSDTYTVVLDTEPVGNVRVTMGGATGTDVSFNLTRLTFTSANWHIARTVTVTAAHDDDAVDEEVVSITHTVTSADDSAYDGVSAGSVAVTVTDDDTAAVTISETTLDIDEGDSDTYTVVLETQPTHNVTITVNDPSNTDVTAHPESLTFTATNWDTAQTVTVSASHDNGHDDEDATVTHTASSSDSHYDGMSVADVLVNVTDDDDVPVTVSFEHASYTVAEGNSVTIKVELSADPERTVEVPITVTTMDGATAADYSGVPASLVFNSGDTEKTFTFNAVQDTVDDDDEGVRLTFGTLPAEVSSTAPSQAVVSITDDDVPQVTVSFEQATYTVAEGGNFNVKVVLSADPERTVTIPITTTNQGGATSADYSGVPANVVFNSGDTEKAFTFNAVQDTVDDDDEGVRLTFGTLPAEVSSTAPSQAVVSITDDDVPQVTVSFEQATYTVAEGDNFNVKVTLSADPERTVTIPLTKTNQGGATSADYSGVPANLVFNSGDTEKTFTFSAASDSVDDDGESVRLGFGSSLPAGVSGGSPDETVISIVDDDVPAVTVSFEQATPFTVAEGDSVTITVQLSADPERTVEVPITATDMDGASSADYSLDPAILVFDAGDTEKSFTFEATDDTDDDDGERVRLTFGTLPARVSSASPSQAVVSINDDDDPAVTVSFEQATYSVAESDDANTGDVTENEVEVTVTLSANPERTVTIPITKTNRGGASSADYSGVPANVVFNRGDTEKTFTFAATEDTVDDDGEWVRLTFGTLPAGVSEGTTDQSVVTIVDDDDPAVTVSFGQASYSVAEGGNVTVTVELSADPERTVTVPILRVNQDGATSADYSGVPSSVVFSSGNTEVSFTFAATDDSVDDDGERVRLSFGTLPTRVTSTSPSQAVVSITDDDDPAVTVSFEQASYTVAEGSSVTVKVELSADPERTVTIPLTKTNHGGATSSDYSGVPANVVFNSGDTETTFTFSAASDSANDDGESVRLRFGSSLPTGVTEGPPDETVISITDDDVPAVTVSFEQATYSVAEGDSVTIKVVLDTDPERTVTIPLTTTNHGGASSSDHSGVPANVVFNSGDTEKTFSFSAAQDTVDDDGESVRLGFGSGLPTGVSEGSPDETVISIVDDDVPSVTVSFEQASYSVAEGDSVTITVQLSADPERTVEVPITVTNMDGVSSADYSVAPASVVFNSGDTEKTFSFSAAQDTLDDDGERVRLGFGSGLPTGVSEGSPDETVVSIVDDDDPAVTVSFGQATYSVAEGDSVNIRVELSADPERTVRLLLETARLDGASPSDYSVLVSVVFNSGDTAKTVTFNAADDADDDDGERVRLEFGSSLPAGVSAGSPDETVVSIIDDDDPAVTVSFGQATYTVAESDDANTGGVAENEVEVTVMLSADPERTVTIPLTTTNQGGASSADYSGVPASVVFNSGDTEKSFTFAAVHDSVDDDGERVRLSFGTLPTGVSEGSPDETVVSIVDDDDPAVTVSFGQATYTAAEGGSVTIKVELSADPERTVTVPILRVNQGGATSADYSGVPSSVVFNSGDTEKSFTFNAADDTVDDDGESVRLSFGTLPARVSDGANDATVVAITDDDDPAVTVSFEQATYTVAEGSTVSVKVVLSADPERTVTIPLTTTNQGGATSSDYSGVPANVVFNAGDTEKTIVFEATDDTANDDGESVRLGFGSGLPAGVSEGSPDETVVSITDDDVPQVTVSFEQATYTVAEGGNFNVKVVLSADPERSVTIPITTTNQGGATSADYSGVPANVVFNAGDTEKIFTFYATSDSVDDDDESVRLGFGSGLPTGVSEGSHDETVVSITDDDDPAVTVSFEQSSYSVAEGDSVTITVQLSADPERTVEVPITVTDMDGAEAADYSLEPASVVFNSGDTEKSFTFEATDDTVDDDGERVRLTFGTVPARVSSTSPSQAVVSIIDNDDPAVTVSFEQATYTVAEGSSVVVKVTLSANPERTVTIPITKTNQGGATSADYSGVPANVVFNRGDTEKTFTFSAASDSVDDDGESVRLGFGSSLPAGVSEGSPDEAVISITDDDVPSVTVSFEQATYSAAEDGNVTIKVTLSADPERTVTVPITTTNQGGAASTDYSGVPANVVFNAGDTEKSFTFEAAHDTVDDDDESVKLTFDTLPTGVSEGVHDATVVSIVDDDDPAVTVSFEQASYTVAEGSSVSVKVVLSADPERTVTIPLNTYEFDGASSADYSGVPSQVVFNSGDTEKSFAFEATDDAADDDGERVRLSLGTLPARVTSTAPSQTTISITDDDVPQVTVSFEQAAYSVAESDDANTGGVAENEVEVTVVLSADPERTVTIPLTTTNQGGASSADYSGVPASVVFHSGDTEKTFTFQAADDSVDDDGERVRLGFGSGLPAGVSEGSVDEAVVSIVDDDDPAVTVSFGQASYSVAEGGSVLVTVGLSADPERTVTVPILRVNQDGASGGDYSGVPSQVVFSSGDTYESFIFTAVDDAVDDDGERVRLSLGTLPARVSEGVNDAAVVSITDDDDPAVTVSFEQAAYSVAEGDSVAIKVELSVDPERTVTIPLTTTNQGGATSSDYSGVPSQVVFDSGDTEKTFTFQAASDSANDDGESVKVGFGSSLPTGVSEGSPDETVVSISDDDVPAVTVSFEQATYAVAEGDSVTIEVTLSVDPERTITIPLTTTHQGGATSSDYSGVPTNVVFNSGDTEKTFTFNATQDTVDDDGERVRLRFGSGLPAGVSEGSPDETVVSITDDDVPAVTVSFEHASYTVAEGNSVTIKVELSADPERTVEVPITVTTLDGASSADFSGVPASVVFNSGDTEKTFTFNATQDTVDDDGEGVRLTFGTVPARVTSTGPSQAVVSITDDDGPPVTVSFGSASHSVVEGESTTVTVTLSANPERTVTIPITRTNQDDASDSDYSGVPANVEFAGGETEKTFTVTATDDEEDDNDESVKLGFGTLPAGVTEGTTNETVVSIVDNDGSGFNDNKGIPEGDATPVTVSFEQDSYSVAEGSTVTIKVVLDADPERTVTIPLTTTHQDGASSSDYSGVPADVVFDSGDTEKSFTLTAVQDEEDESDETLTLGFETLPDGVSAGDTDQADVTIVDSIHVSFRAAGYAAYEGGAGARVTVELDSPAPLQIVIPITATGMNGATSSDWTGVPASLTFASGDTQKSFTLMAYDDQVEDDGESVELGFGALPPGVARGTPSVATVVLMNMEAPTCEAAVWCATAEFADAGSEDWGRLGLGLGYHATQEPYARYSSLSDDRFTFRGKEYLVWSIFTTPGTHPDVDPDAPGRIPEYALLSTHVTEVVGDRLVHRVDPNHQRDWTLYVDGIALPFTDVVTESGTTFLWHHPELQDLFADWTDGDTHEVMIAEDPVSARPEPPATAPTEPRYLRVIPGDGSLTTIWKPPFDDGNSDITHYRLQWKPSTESWSNPNAVSEATVESNGGSLAQVYHFVSGLGNYAHYSVRVIAVNALGDSEPSDEHFGMPQKDPLDITETVVNGNQLTITYERRLDGSSLPSLESYDVLVNGAPRDITGVSISGRSVILTLTEPAKRPIRATDEVAFRYVTPPSGAPAIKDTAGNYAYSCGFGEAPSEARNETDPGLLEPVSAAFTMMPASHRGPGNEVVFRIEFSEPVRVDMGPSFAHLLDVEGGRVTSAWWLDGDTTTWKIVLEPTSSDAVKITLPAGRACDARGAPCGSGERRLDNQPEHTIPGPASMLLISNSPASGRPRIAGTPQIGQALNATTSDIQDQDGMSGAVFAYQWIRRDLGTATDTEINGATGQTYTVTTQDEGKALLVRVTFTDDAGNEESLTSDGVIASPAPTSRAEPANSAATGSPGIEGSPVVGQTLTATTTRIADDDGISTAVFAYQWLADDTAIDGATSSTYTAVAGDEGMAIKVRVTFTDDSGNEESLTSKATGPVVAAPPPLTVSLENSPANHNGADAFTFQIRFSEHPELSFRTLRNHAFVVDGGTVKMAQRQERGSNVAWTITVEPGSSAAVTVVLPTTTDCEDLGAICTEDGRMLSNRLEFTVSGPGE